MAIYAEEALQPWLAALRAAVPDLRIVDGHLHVGLTDPAGFQATAEEVLGGLERADAHGVVFAVANPDGYRAANDEVLELSAANPDRLSAFARLSPDDAAAEAVRCLDAGARGLKVHPRAEDVELDDPRLDDVFALAAERRVPILVHVGVGAEGIGAQARRRAEAHPTVPIVLAHCAIGCFSQVVPELVEVPNLYLDTSWWNVSDLYAALRIAPTGQVLHASDVPFNSPTQAAVMTGRTALQAGLDEEQVRDVMGGTLARLLAGEPVPPSKPPTTPPEPFDPELERLYVTLCSAAVPMLAGKQPGEGLELAAATCRKPRGAYADVLAAVGELIALAERCTEPDPLRAQRTPGWDVILTATLVARTPDVPLP